jgi:hypothetical protein
MFAESSILYGLFLLFAYPLQAKGVHTPKETWQGEREPDK